MGDFIAVSATTAGNGRWELEAALGSVLVMGKKVVGRLVGDCPTFCQPFVTCERTVGAGALLELFTG